jgi:FMN-dependent NADH-azoreductase
VKEIHLKEILVMPTLLHLDSSPRGDLSVSRALTAEFAKNWQAQNPEGTVLTRDLSHTTIAPISGEWIGALFTPADKRTPAQTDVLATSDSLTAELLNADEYVIGVAMINFNIPGALKLWIDQVVRAGVTFAYVDGKPQGLLNGKKAHFYIAAGGEYGPESPVASWNFTEPYLRVIFGFLGVTDVTFHMAGGASALNYGKDRGEFLAPHIEAIQKKFA